MRYSLIIPVYKNEGSIPDLLSVVSELNRKLQGELEAVFVVDGSPDRCYSMLSEKLSSQPFRSRLLLLSRNFGSFSAIRAGLAAARGDFFAVMAADLQEPPELILESFKALTTEPIELVIGTRNGRADPLSARLSSGLFWSLYKHFVQSQMPAGGVDIFACNKLVRDALLALKESNTSLIGQIFWLGFRRKLISYERRVRVHGTSAWTLAKKVRYLADSVFLFPICRFACFGCLAVLA